MSHSKRNTSLAFFTAHERNELKSTWGSKATRLNRDSFLPFGSCQLCLLPAREPVSCPSHGHLFCRECALSNLLAQNKELKRLKKEAEKRKLEDADDKELEDAQLHARAVEEFEQIQAGLHASFGREWNGRMTGRQNGKIMLEQDGEGESQGIKRKFEMDEAELIGLADDRKEKTRRLVSGEKDLKKELPSFWVPGETPDHKRADLKAPKQSPSCPAAAADKPHELALRTLVPVNFTQEKSSEASEKLVSTCASCSKALSNSTKAVLAKPCGHVLCKPCSDKFQKPPQKSAHDKEHDETIRCYVCQEDITPRRKMQNGKDGVVVVKAPKAERGLVELSVEGTGFASGGKNMVKKEGVAFQC